MPELGTLRSLKDLEFLLSGIIYVRRIIQKPQKSDFRGLKDNIKQEKIGLQFTQKQVMKQEQIRKENTDLRQLINNYMEEIQRLKEVNEHHEAEIETLLKFNERLLTIIETQLTQYNTKKSERSYSLQPISEITQRDSQYIDGVNSIKASLLSNFNLEIPVIQEKYESLRGSGGGQTERIHIGNHLEDVMSYEGARSDYQKEYNEYTQPQKVREVISLISAYRNEYGKNLKEYENMRYKIRKDLQSDNNEIRKMNSKKTNFYGQKVAQLNSLRQKMSRTGPQQELQDMLKNGKYSANTQNTLMKLMNSFN